MSKAKKVTPKTTKPESSTCKINVDFMQEIEYGYIKTPAQMHNYLKNTMKENCINLQKAISNNEMLRTVIIQDRITYLGILEEDLIKEITYDVPARTTWTTTDKNHNIK